MWGWGLIMVGNPKRLAKVLALATLALAGVVLAVWFTLRKPLPPLAWVGTTACASCHDDAYRNWLQSDHRHAMEPATGQAVLGNFNNAGFDYAGTRSRFFTRDGKYFVETDNARGELQTFPVAYTFGHYPLQQYLIAFPAGRMQALSISWDSRPAAQGGQRWFHLYPDGKVTHDNPLHWTGAFQNWNSRCASCHSTDLRKNYSQATNSYDTRWQELNVGCEACHGPGSRHVAWANGRRSLPQKGLALQLDKLWAPHDGQLPIPPSQGAAWSGQMQVCSGCHSRRAVLQQPDVVANYFDNYSLGPLLEGRYFADGQMLEEVYEAGSFLQSRMHQNQVSCSNCHEPHSAKVRIAGNGLCLQCHQAQKFETRQHFFHEPGSPGAQCVNCHMPTRTYMGVDVRRDHSLRIPDPVASRQLGVPSACAQCHASKGDQWAADFIARRNGRTTPHYQHATLLAMARQGKASVAPDLLAYARDASRPSILRSIALLESARFSSPQQLQVAGELLASGDPLVRTGAVAALARMDPRQRLALLQPMLGDPARSVRMAVAQQLAQMPLTQAPEPLRVPLGRLFEEYRQSLLYNADMPESMNNLALFQMAQGEIDSAEKSLLHARTLSPRYLPAMLNLADLYRARNRDDLGEPLLHAALAEYPESAEVRHTLGLLYVRTGRTPQSLPLLAQASRMAPGNPQYALVHGLALVETGKRAEGIRVLRAAAQRFPDDTALRQATEAYGR
jgi:predicted CXXCH cytochrome family protein